MADISFNAPRLAGICHLRLLLGVNSKRQILLYNPLFHLQMIRFIPMTACSP